MWNSLFKLFQDKDTEKDMVEKKKKNYSYKLNIFYYLKSASQDFTNITDIHGKSVRDLWMIYWFWKSKCSQWCSAFLGEAVAQFTKNIPLRSAPPRQHK